MTLIGVFIYKTLKYRQQHNFNIKRKRPVLDIKNIVFHPSFDGRIAAIAIDLSR